MEDKEIKKFKDEKDFTLNAVIPWLNLEESYTEIEYTGGNDEFGRDIIFAKKEMGNRKIYYAIQVKDDDIKGNHTNKGVQEILRQLVSAMNTPFIKNNGNTIKIQGLWVITLGDITSQARTAIMNSPEMNGRPIDFLTYKDICKNLEEKPAKVIKVLGLIRIKSKDKNYNFNFKKIFKDELKINIITYPHTSEEDFFESVEDNYLDLSFEIPFEDFLKTPFDKLSFPKNFSVNCAYLRFYYSKIFSKDEIESARGRFLNNQKLKTLEDSDGVYFLFNVDSINKFQEDWIKNVDNLQILQKK